MKNDELLHLDRVLTRPPEISREAWRLYLYLYSMRDGMYRYPHYDREPLLCFRAKKTENLLNELVKAGFITRRAWQGCEAPKEERAGT